MTHVRLRLLLVVLVSGLLSLIEGCAAGMKSSQRVLNAELTILSFGSVNGELAPCG